MSSNPVNNASPSVICGRFAPAPSGPLHIGSMITALGSYLHSKSRGGLWKLRIEDSDCFRSQPGAIDSILHTLENFGLTWDSEVMIQSQRENIYTTFIAELKKSGLLFACACSRKETSGKPYPATCRNKALPDTPGKSLRVITQNHMHEFIDGIQGMTTQNLAQEVGDFIIRRADNIAAYHLAVVIDDAEQHVTEIIRGADLLDSTPRQIYLQQLLGFPRPVYYHLPVAVDGDGKKISKQNHAPAIDKRPTAEVLYQCLQFLGQEPDADLENAGKEEILNWAIANWDVNKVPRSGTIQLTDY